MEVDGEDAEPTVHLRLANIKSLTTLLQAIKIGAKQTCSVILAPEGVWIRWEDDSKTLQSSVQLRSELFTSYECGPTKCVFGVHFAQLVGTLSVFASALGAHLDLHYPGPDGELQLQMCDGGSTGDSQCVLYARMATVEQEAPADMTDYWAEPVSYFLMQGALLKEAVDDLEWPGSAVALKLGRDPPSLTMSATGTGSLEVQLSASDLSGFQVASDQVMQHYKYKNLKAAMSNIPTSKDVGGPVFTKVSLDANGLLKVTHMVPLSGSGGGAGVRIGTSMQPSALAAYTTTQAALDSTHVGVIQFVSLPVNNEE